MRVSSERDGKRADGGVQASCLWTRVCWPIDPFPWPYFLAVNGAAVAALVIQVTSLAHLL